MVILFHCFIASSLSLILYHGLWQASNYLELPRALLQQFRQRTINTAMKPSNHEATLKSLPAWSIGIME